MPERRTTPRKKFSFYMRVLDDDTQKILGHMVEIGAIGLQLETSAPLPLEKDYYLRLELPPELGAVNPVMIFIARTKWCKMDDIEPNLYRVGFEIVEIMPDDKEVFMHLLAKYGK
jgi:hypothetical protein